MLELRSPDFLSTDFLVHRKGKSFAVWPADVDDQDDPIKVLVNAETLPGLLSIVVGSKRRRPNSLRWVSRSRRPQPNLGTIGCHYDSSLTEVIKHTWAEVASKPMRPKDRRELRGTARGIRPIYLGWERRLKRMPKQYAHRSKLPARALAGYPTERKKTPQLIQPRILQ
jgi:hypothetical protein